MNELGYYGQSIPDSRPLHSQRLPISTEKATARIPWTTARCNRLLRPLSSKIALLRKEGQIEADSGLIRNAANISATSSDKGGRFGRQPSAIGASTAADAEWESNPRPCKKIKRTYSAKPRTIPSRESDNDRVDTQACWAVNEAVIELPIQLALDTRASETSIHVAESNQFQKPPPVQHPRGLNSRHELPKSLAPNNWRLVDGICKGLVALLKATDSWHPPSTTGCRSLFSTCLRQAPKYIAEEERLSKVDDPDTNIDMSSMVYSDLEEFGSMPGGGWEPLREMVRAHGIKMIADAIEEGLLGLSVARHLFYLCLDISAYDEAQSIIESLTILATPPNHLLSKKVKQLPHELQLVTNSLSCLATRSGRQAFLYRHTAVMLDREILPTTWVSSKAMIATWNRVIHSIAQEDEDAHSAAVLLRTAVTMSHTSARFFTSKDVHDTRIHIHAASRRPALRSANIGQTSEDNINSQPKMAASNGALPTETDGEVGSTLSNVLTVLSAITRLRTSARFPSPNVCKTYITTVLHELSLEALQAIDSMSRDAYANYSNMIHADSIRLPLLAAGFAELQCSGFSKASHHQHPSLGYLARLASNNEVSSYTGSFVCAIARCCGRARSEDPFDAVQAIVQDLSKPAKSICSDTPVRKLCSDLALTAAFAYAEDTSRPSHLDWALQIERNLAGGGAGTPKPAIVRTPARSIKQSKSGYRWEEGICEWIAKTPNLLLQKPGIVRTNIDDGDEAKEAFNFTEVKSEAATPVVTEVSPCAVSKKPAKEVGKVKQGQAKVLHVLVQPEPSKCDSKGTNGLRSMVYCQRPKKACPLVPFQRICEDEDFDELSAPDSSQEETLALSRMQRPPNAVPGAKRKRWPHRNQNTCASKTSTITSSTEQTLQSSSHLHDSDMAEDELAVLFRW